MKQQTDFEFEEKQPLSPPKTMLPSINAPPASSGVKEGSQPGAEAAEQRSEQDQKKLLEKFDPENIHYNYFYVGISGYIESGQFPFLDGLSCKYTLVCGKDWQLADVIILFSYRS